MLCSIMHSVGCNSAAMKAALQMPECGTKAVVQQHAEAAAEKAVGLLSQLPSISCVAGQQQLADAMEPLLPARGAGAAIHSVLRVAVASRLGAALAHTSGCSAEAQETAAAALSMLVKSASSEELTKMAGSAPVVHGLASYLEQVNKHGCGYTTVSAMAYPVQRCSRRIAFQSSFPLLNLAWLLASTTALQLQQCRQICTFQLLCMPCTWCAISALFIIA
jgi:hypothetical protein